MFSNIDWYLLIVSKFKESATDFLVSSTAIAFSNAFRFTILEHSTNFALASLSLGLALVTWDKNCFKEYKKEKDLQIKIL